MSILLIVKLSMYFKTCWKVAFLGDELLALCALHPVSRHVQGRTDMD